MGADLYINSLPDETRRGGFEVSEEAVRSGYFRDAYNGWGIFAVMTATLEESISWWEISDKKEWFNSEAEREEDGLTMTSEGCKEFWAWMQPKVNDFLGRKELYRREYSTETSTWSRIKITSQKDIEALKEHAELFSKFYRYACELGSSVGWSV